MKTTKTTVTRLSNYRRTLYKLKALGFIKVFSDNLGDAIGVSAAQVRKDFSLFNITGQKKGGYEIQHLIERLNLILGKDELQEVIVVGCGRMGQTLMNYHSFIDEGIKVIAGFDSDPGVINPEARNPIFDIADIAEFIQKSGVKVAVLTVPEHIVAGSFEHLKDAGIKGLLNCTPMQLQSSINCEVRNLNIGIELENLFYFVK